MFLSSVYFHDTIENRMMLLLLKIPFVSKRTRVFYHDANTDERTEKVTLQIRETIGREKMGDSSTPVVLSTMQTDTDEFVNLFFDESDFKKQLLSTSETIELYPTSIVEYDDFVRIFFGSVFFDVEYLINTIPQPFFCPLVDSDSGIYKYKPLVFVTTQSTEEECMIYSYNNCFWKRQFIKSGIKCIEFDKEDWDEQRFKLYFPEIKKYKVTEMPYGRIKSIDVKDTNRIKHVGRFAQWQHSITTEHVINKLLKLNL